MGQTAMGDVSSEENTSTTTWKSHEIDERNQVYILGNTFLQSTAVNSAACCKGAGRGRIIVRTPIGSVWTPGWGQTHGPTEGPWLESLSSS